MMSDLAAFLAARLDEDEHWARMAEAGWPPGNALAASEDPEHYAFMATDITPSKATFIRHHGPARVLREVAAKRAILDEYNQALAAQNEMLASPAGDQSVTYEWENGRVCALLNAIHGFAAVYDDHPEA